MATQDKIVNREVLDHVGPHPMFSALRQINRRHDVKMRNTPEGEQAAKTRQVVTEYIDTMLKYRDQLTPEMLLDEENQMRDVLDPVFVVLARAIGGAELITSNVWGKMRNSWCGYDFPTAFEDVPRIQDDQRFVQKFQEYSFNEGDNVKLLALQRMNVVQKLVTDRYGK